MDKIRGMLTSETECKNLCIYACSEFFEGMSIVLIRLIRGVNDPPKFKNYRRCDLQIQNISGLSQSLYQFPIAAITN